jgi:hypothetical protein
MTPSMSKIIPIFLPMDWRREAGFKSPLLLLQYLAFPLKKFRFLLGNKIFGL